MTPAWKLITIFYHEEGSTWWADSPDVPGWTCFGDRYDEIRALAVEGVREFVGADCIISEALPVTAAPSGVIEEVFTGALESADFELFQFSVTTLPSPKGAPAPYTGIEFEQSIGPVEQAS